MKKNSGGYVLVYVLIVIVLLSLLALGVCSIALRNLQTQQASVEQMQEQYETEGLIERFVANLQAIDLNGNGQESAAHSAFVTEIETLCNGIDGLTLTAEPQSWESVSSIVNGWRCKLAVRAETSGAVVSADLDVTMAIAIEEHNHYDEDGVLTSTTYTYGLSNIAFTYEAYDISTGSAAGDEGGEAA